MKKPEQPNKKVYLQRNIKEIHSVSVGKKVLILFFFN